MNATGYGLGDQVLMNMSGSLEPDIGIIYNLLENSPAPQQANGISHDSRIWRREQDYVIPSTFDALLPS